jgi:hypothetical protein
MVSVQSLAADPAPREQGTPSSANAIVPAPRRPAYTGAWSVAEAVVRSESIKTVMRSPGRRVRSLPDYALHE